VETRTRSRWIALAACVAAIVTAPAHAGAANKACALLTPSELETALGDKVTMEPHDETEGVTFCSGKTPKATVMLRIATRREGTADADKRGVEKARQMGAQVDVKTFGPMTCSTVVPPENLASHGFATTCAIVKGALVAAIDITAKARNDMVPIERLKPVAEKMAARF
jgi:hypothetical protein